MAACTVELADPQLIRYSRHIMLPQIDLEGQERLLGGKVLLVGAGGLGAPASLYLAAAGVGQLTICDGDTVDLTNLQRQIVHREARIGINKAESAKIALGEINPDCRVITVPHRVGPEELATLVAAADVVVDGCDNFATRHAVNAACVAARKPLVSGAAIRFSGQLAVFDTRRADAPCYRCLFPDTPDGPDDADRCAVMGVFAPLTGIIGTAQAAETIRLLVSDDSPLIGQLVLFDAMGMDWQKIRVPRDPACPVCGTRD
jgi:molybdopterin-synthase adenylyltransferase